MPKLVDYVSRFQEIREAVYEVTLRDGPAAVNLGSVAVEMGLSVSSLRRLLRSAEALPRLGVQWAEGLMREHMFSVPVREHRSGDPVDRPIRALLHSLPLTDTLADAERAWRGLVGAHDRRAAWAREARAAQAEAQESLCRRVVTALGLPAEVAEYEVIRLRMLVEGVTVGICERTVDPASSAAVIRRHLKSLAGERLRLDGTRDDLTEPAPGPFDAGAG